MSYRIATVAAVAALLAAFSFPLAYADTKSTATDAAVATKASSTTEPENKTEIAEEPPAPDAAPSKPYDGSAESANEITSAVANHIYATWRENGYVDQICDPDKLGITLIWKAAADLPPALLNYVKSKPYGVDITVKSTARYDRNELWQGRNRILADPLATKLGLIGGTLNQDGSGMTFISSQAPAPTDDQLRHLNDISGIDSITINPTKVSGPSDYASRQNDRAG